MLKSAASKVMWVGRATVFLVGLAVILALVFGITSTAFAHRGDKGFFHLGHRNVKHAVSKLVGKVAGPSLVIGNGSADRRATALRLNVKPGKAPMQVSSDTKVRKLNADKLDGKDASAIGVNGVERVEARSERNSNSAKAALASCPEGKIVVGTGGHISGGYSGTGPNSETDVVISSIAPYSDSVYVLAFEEEATSANWSVTAYAICAKAP